jgi:hypothetical protein
VFAFSFRNFSLNSRKPFCQFREFQKLPQTRRTPFCQLCNVSQAAAW